MINREYCATKSQKGRSSKEDRKAKPLLNLRISKRCLCEFNDACNRTTTRRILFPVQIKKSISTTQLCVLETHYGHLCGDGCCECEGQSAKKNAERIVGKDNLRLAEAIISDGDTIIQLDIWEDNIALIEEGEVYTFSALTVRECIKGN